MLFEHGAVAEADKVLLEMWQARMARSYIDSPHGTVMRKSFAWCLREQCPIRLHKDGFGTLSRLLAQPSWNWSVFGPSGRCEHLINTLLHCGHENFDPESFGRQTMQNIADAFGSGEVPLYLICPISFLLVIRGEISAANQILDSALEFAPRMLAGYRGHAARNQNVLLAGM